MIKNLTLENWNQFKDLNINFHHQVTIITGTNGSGKSTIVRLISNLLGWEYKEIATPINSPDISAHFSAGITPEKLRNVIEENPNMGHIKIGNITCNNNQVGIDASIQEDSKIDLYVPRVTLGVDYPLDFSHVSNDFNIHGVSIASHRIPYTYSALKSIPVKPMTKGEAFNNYNESLKKRVFPEGYHNLQDDIPTSHIKATLMSLALFGQDNDHITGDKEAYKVFKGFIRILKILLPDSLGFNDIMIKEGEVILKTDTGDFLIDSVSGGIGAVIDLAWQIYMYDKESPFLVIIDEIENHLHPSMQRNVLPNLIKAFPHAQFIVTTHSPFVVNSVINSNVYALKYDDNKKVCSFELDFNNKSANALEILRDVLGVPVTLPIWIEEKLDVVIKKYSDTQLTAKTYTDLKNELSEIGLDEHMPQALDILQRGYVK